jgi:hypothetical protein
MVLDSKEKAITNGMDSTTFCSSLSKYFGGITGGSSYFSAGDTTVLPFISLSRSTDVFSRGVDYFYPSGKVPIELGPCLDLLASQSSKTPLATSSCLRKR